MSDLALRSAGGLLIMIAIGDIFLTVLYARSDAGIVTPVLLKRGWRLFRITAGLFGRHNPLFLSLAGPLLLLTIAIGWVLLLAIGFALVFWPDLGHALTKSAGETPTDFLTALYYSGFCLTTLGIGDISPAAGSAKLLTIIEAALGFSFFTLTITYFLSVYSALQRRNTLASLLDHKCGGTGNPIDFLLLLGSGDRLTDAREEFRDMAVRIADLLESHIFYPVLHYFHFRQVRYALPRIIYLLMDSVSLLRTFPVPGCDRIEPALIEVENACRNLLHHLGEVFLQRHRPERHPPAAADVEHWRYHFREAANRLRLSGVLLPSDLTVEEELYIAHRRDWHPFVVGFATSLGYRLQEVLGGDCLP